MRIGESPSERYGINNINLAELTKIEPGKEIDTKLGGVEETSKSSDEKQQCQTCWERRYVDGSDDPGVSFKSPGYISPEASKSVVSAHEQEHVSGEQSKAHSEEREIVSQTVTLSGGVCPECGKFYVAGGVTETVTKSKDPDIMEDYKDFLTKNFGIFVDERT